MASEQFIAQQVRAGDGAVFRQGHDYNTYYVTNTTGERSRTNLTPSDNIPFARDPKFVGREDIIEQIRSIRKDLNIYEHCRIALVGFGGFGKSQIAIEYAHRVREEHPGTWVFWIYGGSTIRVKQGFKAIADKVDIPGRNDPRADILNLVYHWLCNKEYGNWLLVLDNVDDENTFFQGPNNASALDNTDNETSLAKFLPQCAHGSMLITSRYSAAANRLLLSADNMIAIGPMSEELSLELLKTRIPISEDAMPSAKELIREMDGIPLALVQAASYLRMRNRITIQQYLKFFQESEVNQTSLLNYQRAGESFRRDPEVSHAVITTWQISFEQIQNLSQPAADMLSLMSVLERVNIPEALLVPDENDGLVSADALALLIDFSLVTEVQEKNSFSIHRLVQLATREWLDSRGELSRWRNDAVVRIANLFPQPDYGNWTLCEALFPHTKKVTADQPQQELHALAWATICHLSGWYIGDRGDFDSSEAMIKDAVSVRKRILGDEHELTLSSMGALALLYRDQGRLKEAEELGMQTVGIEQRVLGTEHPQTLNSMSNLASTYMRQGRLKEAEKLCMQTMKLRQRVLGSEHPETLVSMNNLARTYKEQRRLEEAEELHTQTMKIEQRVLGNEHPDTLYSMNNLAATYEEQGRLEEAEKLHTQTVKLRQRMLGNEHPNTLLSMHNLARVCYRKGQHEKAIAMLRKVVLSRERRLCPTHPDTISSVKVLEDWLRSDGT